MSDNESEEEYEVEAIVDFRDEGKVLSDSDFCWNSTTQKRTRVRLKNRYVKLGCIL